jgi:hypothetical protein
VANLYETNFFLIYSQCFENSVNAIARQTEHGINTPIDQSLHQQLGYCLSHFTSNLFRVKRQAGFNRSIEPAVERVNVLPTVLN